MSRPKRETALFDLLPEDRDDPKSLKVPNWWQRSDDCGTEPASRTRKGLGETATARTRERSGSEGFADRVPFFALDGERIRLSFNSFTAGVTIFAIMVVLVGAFEWGRRSGSFDGFRLGHAAGRESYAAEALGEIAEARRREPSSHLVGTLLEEATDPGNSDSATGGQSEPAKPAGWIREFTYVVAQEFSADRTEDVDKTRLYLAGRGVATQLVRLRNGALQLITSQGYDLGDPTQRRLAEELKKRVREIGTAYFSGGGGYKLEGYFKTLKNDNW